MLYVFSLEGASMTSSMCFETSFEAGMRNTSLGVSYMVS